MSYNTDLQSNNSDLQDILNRVNSLPDASESGSAPLPDLTNPGDASDLAAGKELIDQNGNVVTGTVQVVSSDLLYGATSIKELNDLDGDPSVRVRVDMSSDYLMRENSRINAYAKLPEFGNAQPSQVVKGATFTSAAGFLAEGTHECSGGITLPTLTTPATATDLALDKQLIDADGNIVTGTLYETEVGTKIYGGTGIQISGTPGSTTFNMGGIYQEDRIGDNTIGFIARPGAQFWVRNAPTSLFGDAAVSDVAKGKTFTSADGLLVEGTMEAGSGGVTLPTLESPGDENDLLEGVQLIGQGGTIVNGTIPKKTVDDITINGPTTTVPSGYYENNVSVSVPSVTAVSPTIDVAEDGVITASVTHPAGYVSASTTSSTIHLDVLEAQEITPGAFDQTIESGLYLTGAQLIKGDSNLSASNIVKGASIFGIDGTAGVTVSDLTSVGGLHYWAKYNGEPSLNYIEKSVVNTQFLVSSKIGVSTSTYKIYYGDSFTYDADSMQFNLNSTSYCYTLASAQEKLPGKYIRYNTDYSSIYYVPDTATFKESTSSYVATSTYIIISNATKFTANKLINYVASDVNSTYPENGEHTDGYWYVYGGLLSDAIEDESSGSDGETIPSVEQAVPSISISNNGLITASVTQEEGYVSAGTIESTLQLSSLGKRDIMPNTNDQIIKAETYISGDQTIKGDENLTPDNIRSGVTIFEVTGTYESELDSVVPIELGGTGASDGTTGLTNLLHSGHIILKEGQDYHYGSTLPPAGNVGRLFFLRASE